MYLCNRCQAAFDIPHVVKEDWGEPLLVCPECTSDDIEEAGFCQCGNAVPIYDLVEGLCEECRGSVQHRYIEMLEANFLPDEIKYIFSHSFER